MPAAHVMLYYVMLQNMFCLPLSAQGLSLAYQSSNKQHLRPAADGDVAMDIGKMDNWTEWIMSVMNGYLKNGYVCNMCTKQGKATVPKKGDGLVFYHTLCPLCSLSLFSLLHKHVSFFPFLSPLSG